MKPGNHNIPRQEFSATRQGSGWLLFALLSAVGGFSGLLFGENILTVAGLVGGIAATTGLSRCYRRKSPPRASNAPDSLHLLANLSHEIRTPMSAILGFAELLEDASPRERAAYLRTIENNGEHVLRLLDNVLDHAGYQLGSSCLGSQETNIRTLAQETCDTFAPQAAAKGLLLQLKIDDEVPRRITTDPTRLRQVVCNLLANAVKFTCSGKVTMHLEHRADIDQLTCHITDTGIGLSSKASTRIFHAFQKERGAGIHGTGLGLHISREIAEALGGSLDVESSEGVGSTFTLRIPAAEISTESDHATLDTSQLQGCSIVVAEDCPDNRRLLRCLLENCGAQVLEAENGHDALVLASNTPTDLMILDMNMPIMDGHQTARELRRRGHSCPVLALTAHATRHDQDAFHEAGCTAFLAKPIRRTAFLKVVFRLLSAQAAPRIAG